MNLIGNRLILIPDAPQDKTSAGIYLPGTVVEERNVGLIAIIGDTCNRRFEHRRAIFAKNTGEKIVYEGLNGLLLYSHDIIAFLD